ncbi:acyl carrier protein [Amycolatopsis sp. lyj-109]|uniref:acyl carrier protein n=1 Tax=Amycolatopsis sp. lyj-109 TaxID=2789287 RepID=UPI00397D5666
MNNPEQTMTIDELKQILREGSGQDENVDLDGDIIDVDFADLGYDSIALMETGGRIERERGIQLDEDGVTEAKTPRSFLVVVNESLGQVDQR